MKEAAKKKFKISDEREIRAENGKRNGKFFPPRLK